MKTKYFLLSFIVTLSLLSLLGIFNSVGNFTLAETTENEVDFEKIKPALELANSIKDSKDPKDVILHTAKMKGITLEYTSYPKTLDEFSKESLRKEILRMYSLKNIELTQKQTSELDSDLLKLDNDFSKRLAYVLSSVNDASILNSEATSSLTQSDIDFLREYDPMNPFDQDRFDGIQGKIDLKKQLQGSLYVLDTVKVFENYQTSSSNFIDMGDCSKSGDAFSDSMCLVVVGSELINIYENINPSIHLDLGGNDEYYCQLYENICQGGGDGILIDYGGNDTYLCHASSSYETVCQGSARINPEYFGVGLLVDYFGDDDYKCTGSGNDWRHNCQGSGYGISTLIDYGGNDKYGCYDNDDSRCQGVFGGSIIDYGGNDTYYCTKDLHGSGIYCQGVVYGTLIDFSGYDTATCDMRFSVCMGGGMFNPGIVLDLDVRYNDYDMSCSLACFALSHWTTQFLGTGWVYEDILPEHANRFLDDPIGYSLWIVTLYANAGVKITNDLVDATPFLINRTINDINQTSNSIDNLTGSIKVKECSTVENGNDEIYYNLGLILTVDGSEYGSCQSGSIGTGITVPGVSKTVRVPANVYIDGNDLVIQNCDITVSSTEIVRINNCQDSQRVNVPDEVRVSDYIPTDNLYLDQFECSSCTLDGQQNSQSLKLIYYASDWSTQNGVAHSTSNDFSTRLYFKENGIYDYKFKFKGDFELKVIKEQKIGFLSREVEIKTCTLSSNTFEEYTSFDCTPLLVENNNYYKLILSGNGQIDNLRFDQL